MKTLEEIAKMIDHSLLHPTMTDEELRQGCQIAKAYEVAAVCIKPYAVRQALSWLRGSTVKVCTVVGFPHGSSATSIKVAEALQACQEGAEEIDMVVNVGKVLSDEWDYVEEEISLVQQVALAHGAIVKVIFENDFLPDEQDKIRLCQICSEIGVAFVKTSTGYGFVKDAQGGYGYKGATEADLRLMRKHSGEAVQIKAAGGVRSLDDLLKVRELGVSRIGATATVAIMEEAKKRLGLANTAQAAGSGDRQGY